jgi:hypothetical protein
MIGTAVRRLFPIGFLLLGACAGAPPVEDFRAYSEAFTEARITGNVLLDDVAVAMDVAAARAQPAPPADAPKPLFPDSFDPASVIAPAAGGEAPAIAARRQAFATVAQYNEILLELAEGRSAEEASAGVATLGDNVAALAKFAGSAANPLFGIGLSALQQAVALAERYRSREEFAQAILSGYGDVDGILQALIDDTPTLYEIQKNRFQLELTATRAEANRALNTMRALAANFAAPAPASALAERHGRVERELSFALSGMLGQALQLTLPPSGAADAPAYSMQVADGLESQLAGIKDLADAHGATVARINDYHAALGSYVAVLDQARRSLAVVKAAVETPPEPGAVAREVITTAFELRRKVDDLRSRLHAIRSPS